MTSRGGLHCHWTVAVASPSHQKVQVRVPEYSGLRTVMAEGPEGYEAFVGDCVLHRLYGSRDCDGT